MNKKVILLIEKFKIAEAMACRMVRKENISKAEHNFICSVFGKYLLLKDILFNEDEIRKYKWLETYYINN